MPLKYGTLLGLLLIVFGIVNITIGGIFYSQKNNLGFLLFPIVMIPAFIEFNKNPIKSKYLFWKALQYGVMISVIAAFLYSIFTLFYGFYYYDANKDLILATLRKKLESNEIPENEIIEELHNIKSHIIIGLIKISLIYPTVVGSIYSLIFTPFLFFKKWNNLFNRKTAA